MYLVTRQFYSRYKAQPVTVLVKAFPYYHQATAYAVKMSRVTGKHYAVEQKPAAAPHP